jgi:hypothetical protein
MSRAFTSSLSPSASSSFNTFRSAPLKSDVKLMINPPTASDFRYAPLNHPKNLKPILDAFRVYISASKISGGNFCLDRSWAAKWANFAVRFSFILVFNLGLRYISS